MDLQKIRNLNLDRMLDIEEPVSISAEIRILENEFKALGLATPGWLENAAEAVRAEIARRTHAADMAALKALDAEIEGYKTANERRADALKRQESLQKKLGLSTTGAKK